MWVMLKVEEHKIMVVHTTQSEGIRIKGPTDIEQKEVGLNMKIMDKVIIKVHNKGV